MHRNHWLRRTIDQGVSKIARTRDLSWWAAALLGVACAVTMLSVRLVLDEAYGGATGFMILLPAVMIAALAGGLTAGLVAAAACLLGGWLLIANPQGAGPLPQWSVARASTINFVVVSLFASVLSASLRSTLRRLDASLRALDATSDEVRLSEAARRDSEVQLRAMVEQAAAGIARVNLEGRLVSANARLADILRRSQHELIGIRIVDVTHPEDVEATLDIMQSTSGQIEKRYVRPDGSQVWCLTSVAPLSAADGSLGGYIAVVVDISDAKSAESALRESEARFRLLADTAPSPIWLTNETGEVEFVNAALEVFFGAPAGTLVGHVWRNAIHSDDQDLVNDAQAAARPALKPYGFECRFQRADGVWRWMRVSVSPRFVDGVFRGYVGLSFDVTESREALDTLASLERRQTFLLELSDRLRDMSLPSDILGEAVTALGERTQADRVIFGEVDRSAGLFRIQASWARNEELGTDPIQIDRFEAVNQALSRGVTVAVCDVLVDPLTASSIDESHRGQMAFIGTPLMRAGRFCAFLAISQSEPKHWTPEDISLVEAVAERTWSEVERVRAEAEVLESEARFRAIADTAPVLIWVTGADRKRLFVNQAYVTFCGLTKEDALTADWASLLHPDDYESTVRQSLEGEASGEPFSLEARYRHHDGGYRWLKSLSRPRRSDRTGLAGFVGVAFDITDARRAEDDLKRINELLEERVSEALAEKARAEAELMHAQKMEAVGRLTGGVAHDFNNLLTVVIGALDMMLKSPDDAARRKKLGEAALAAARRGEGLTHQLLAFSRRQALRPEVVDLNDLISQGMPLLKRAVGDSIILDTRFRAAGARAKVDVAQLEAALLNLLVNARDAIGERKRGKVTIRTRSFTLRAGAVPDLKAGRFICVSVQDNGSGMDAETLTRVFEPFFTTKAVGKGTGLGLSQVYGFTRQSGGGAQILSTPGRGSEVRLYLPSLDSVTADASAAVLQRTASRLTTERLNGCRLLLVEDDPQVSDMAVVLLHGLGLKTATASTASQAMALLARQRFDIMLSDVVMPGDMSGIDLARACSVKWPEMKILLTSGYAGEDVDDALSNAPWRLLPKPYSGEQLGEALARELGAKP